MTLEALIFALLSSFIALMGWALWSLSNRCVRFAERALDAALLAPESLAETRKVEALAQKADLDGAIKKIVERTLLESAGGPKPTPAKGVTADQFVPMDERFNGLSN